MTLTWKTASGEDGALVSSFLAAGGSGNSSIDEFVERKLIDYSVNKYSHTSFLLNAQGVPLGLVSNSMGSIRLDYDDWISRNMLEPPSVIPALFLHRLGVVVAHRGKGLGTLLILRIFETLIHADTHTTAPVIALLVEKRNTSAKDLYGRMFFEKVEGHQSRSHDLFIVPYESAERRIASLARQESSPE
ncbi:MAG: GNAT family N-acetyltransferase [Opitutaceae bacterium]|nr:GNAT family N-acetyltransferase [Opitutaceae bacterium]